MENLSATDRSSVAQTDAGQTNAPNDQTSDLLLNLLYLITSGADHLTGNLEHWELVYWSSKTNLKHRQWGQHYTAVSQSTFRLMTRLYLVMPKSDTLTSLLCDTRQFLAACRRETLIITAGFCKWIHKACIYQLTRSLWMKLEFSR